MVLKNYRTLAQSQDWDGTAQTIITQLPRDFLAQRYILDLNSPTIKTVGGTSILVTDALLKCITNIKIVAVGEGSSRTIFEVSGQDLFHMNNWDYGAPASFLLVPTTTSDTQAHAGWVIDFRCNKLDPDDYSVALPTYLLSTLQLEVTYVAPSATTWGTNFPTSAGWTANMTMKITCVEGIAEAGEDFSSNPLMTVLSKTVTADTSTGSLQDFDTFFQVGALIRRDFVCIEDSSNVRSDAQCNNFQVNSGTIPLMSNIQFSANKSKDIQNYRLGNSLLTQQGGLATMPTTPPFDTGNFSADGYTMIDFYNNRMPFISTAGGLRIGGLSTVGYNTGDLIFQVNQSGASSNIRRVQETVEG